MRTARSTPEERAAALARGMLFSGLEAGDLRSIAAFTSLREYDAAEVLFAQGTPADGFYVVASGNVKVCRFGLDGREQVLHVFGQGETCGEVAVFQGHPYPATAIAVGALAAVYVSRERFLSLCRDRPEILLDVVAVMSVRLRQFVQLIDDLSLKEVSARLAKYILDLATRSGGGPEVELDIAKVVLASRLGTIAETLSRTLAKMGRRGIIKVRGRRISILDRRALEALAAGVKL